MNLITSKFAIALNKTGTPNAHEHVWVLIIQYGLFKFWNETQTIAQLMSL